MRLSVITSTIIAVCLMTASFILSGYLSTIPCYLAGFCRKDEILKHMFHLAGLAGGFLVYIKLCEKLPIWPLDKETKHCEIIPRWVPFNGESTLNHILTCFKEYTKESIHLGTDIYRYCNQKSVVQPQL